MKGSTFNISFIDPGLHCPCFSKSLVVHSFLKLKLSATHFSNLEGLFYYNFVAQSKKKLIK